jgi:hypothetical protein
VSTLIGTGRMTGLWTCEGRVLVKVVLIDMMALIRENEECVPKGGW